MLLLADAHGAGDELLQLIVLSSLMLPCVMVETSGRSVAGAEALRCKPTGATFKDPFRSPCTGASVT
jgi:hypothetical protein